MDLLLWSSLQEWVFVWNGPQRAYWRWRVFQFKNCQLLDSEFQMDIFFSKNPMSPRKSQKIHKERCGDHFYCWCMWDRRIHLERKKVVVCQSWLSFEIYRRIRAILWPFHFSETFCRLHLRPTQNKAEISPKDRQKLKNKKYFSHILSLQSALSKNTLLQDE